jgi:hypothetical protein
MTEVLHHSLLFVSSKKESENKIYRKIDPPFYFPLAPETAAAAFNARPAGKSQKRSQNAPREAPAPHHIGRTRTEA